ncbi:hypothetical protein FOZ62_029250, partial [Perkinsus olseni]
YGSEQPPAFAGNLQVPTPAGVVIIPDRLRKVGYIVEPLSLVAESISPDEARSFDARRAGDKEPVRAAVGPSVLPNSWTPTPKKVEYRATSAAVHPLSKSERCPPSRLSHPMSPQQQRQASVKVVPAASVGLLPATTHCLLTETHHITDAAVAVPSSFSPPVAFPDDPPHPARQVIHQPCVPTAPILPQGTPSLSTDEEHHDWSGQNRLGNADAHRGYDG